MLFTCMLAFTANNFIIHNSNQNCEIIPREIIKKLITDYCNERNFRVTLASCMSLRVGLKSFGARRVFNNTFIICTIFILYMYDSDQVKTYEMGGTCSTYG
jgi:hypothetical protein